MSPPPAPVLHIRSVLTGISSGVWWGDDALMKMNIQLLEKGSWNDSQLVPAAPLKLAACKRGEETKSQRNGTAI